MRISLACIGWRSEARWAQVSNPNPSISLYLSLSRCLWGSFPWPMHPLTIHACCIAPSTDLILEGCASWLNVAGAGASLPSATAPDSVVRLRIQWDSEEASIVGSQNREVRVSAQVLDPMNTGTPDSFLERADPTTLRGMQLLGLDPTEHMAGASWSMNHGLGPLSLYDLSPGHEGSEVRSNMGHGVLLNPRGPLNDPLQVAFPPGTAFQAVATMEETADPLSDSAPGAVQIHAGLEELGFNGALLNETFRGYETSTLGHLSLLSLDPTSESWAARVWLRLPTPPDSKAFSLRRLGSTDLGGV